MKKLIATFLMMALMAIALPLSVDAQSKRCYTNKKRTNYSRSYARNRRSRSYANRRYAARGYTYKRPSLYRRHRNLINVGLATGGGALIGGLLGGNRRSMAAGALIGAGSGALYTYVLKPKKRRY